MTDMMAQPAHWRQPAFDACRAFGPTVGGVQLIVAA
jgi:hypothetical protein